MVVSFGEIIIWLLVNMKDDDMIYLEKSTVAAYSPVLTCSRTYELNWHLGWITKVAKMYFQPLKFVLKGQLQQINKEAENASMSNEQNLTQENTWLKILVTESTESIAIWITATEWTVEEQKENKKVHSATEEVEKGPMIFLQRQ